MRKSAQETLRATSFPEEASRQAVTQVVERRGTLTAGRRGYTQSSGSAAGVLASLHLAMIHHTSHEGGSTFDHRTPLSQVEHIVSAVSVSLVRHTRRSIHEEHLKSSTWR